MCFRFRKTEGFLAEGDALNQKGHVPRQNTHGLLALFVHFGLAFIASVNGVPILAGGNGHIGNGEVLIELIKGRRAAATPGAHHGRAHLHGLVKVCAVEKSVKQRDQGGVCRGIVNRTCHHKAVCLFKFFGDFIDRVIKDAFTRSVAVMTRDTAADILMADLHRFRLYALFDKYFLHLAYGNGSVAFRPGTAVDNQNLHNTLLTMSLTSTTGIF